MLFCARRLPWGVLVEKVEKRNSTIAAEAPEKRGLTWVTLFVLPLPIILAADVLVVLIWRSLLAPALPVGTSEPFPERELRQIFFSFVPFLALIAAMLLWYRKNSGALVTGFMPVGLPTLGLAVFFGLALSTLQFSILGGSVVPGSFIGEWAYLILSVELLARSFVVVLTEELYFRGGVLSWLCRKMSCKVHAPPSSPASVRNLQTSP